MGMGRFIFEHVFAVLACDTCNTPWTPSLDYMKVKDADVKWCGTPCIKDFRHNGIACPNCGKEPLVDVGYRVSDSKSIRRWRIPQQVTTRMYVLCRKCGYKGYRS